MIDPFYKMIKDLLVGAPFDTHVSILQNKINKYNEDKNEKTKSDIMFQIGIMFEKKILEEEFRGDRKKMDEDFQVFKETMDAVPEATKIFDEKKPFE